jgi:hypothetical protein
LEGRLAVSTALLSATSTSSALTPITARARDGVPGKSGRLIPTKETTTAHTASTAPAT